MSTLSTVAAPMGPRGFVAKAGTLAAGTALAGAALLGGTTVAPVISSGLAASVQQDFALTASPTFSESLQSLLGLIKFGDVGQVLNFVAPGIGSDSTVAQLLAALNSDHYSLDKVTGGLLSMPFDKLLEGITIGNSNLGDVPIDTLVTSMLGGAGASATLGTVMDAMGLHDYAGFLNLPFLGLNPDSTTVADLLNMALGITSTTSINDLLEANGMDSATIGGLLDISPAQLGADWNLYVDSLNLGGSLLGGAGENLGSQDLGDLLGNMLGIGSLTDDTTLTSILTDLGVFSMLGLS